MIDHPPFIKSKNNLIIRQHFFIFAYYVYSRVIICEANEYVLAEEKKEQNHAATGAILIQNKKNVLN